MQMLSCGINQYLFCVYVRRQSNDKLLHQSRSTSALPPAHWWLRDRRIVAALWRNGWQGLHAREENLGYSHFACLLNFEGHVRGRHPRARRRKHELRLCHHEQGSAGMH
jgi:hypothetical protein